LDKNPEEGMEKTVLLPVEEFGKARDRNTDWNLSLQFIAAILFLSWQPLATLLRIDKETILEYEKCCPVVL
jgi:hypothetical protein